MFFEGVVLNVRRGVRLGQALIAGESQTERSARGFRVDKRDSRDAVEDRRWSEGAGEAQFAVILVIGVRSSENQFDRVVVLGAVTRAVLTRAVLIRAVPDRCVRRGVMSAEHCDQQRPKQTQTGSSNSAARESHSVEQCTGC